MPQRLSRLASPLFGAAALALAAAAAPAAQPTAGMKLNATLTGAAEVPSGDTNATGSFTGTFNAAHDQLCYELKSAKFDTPTAAHIHQGVIGQNGAPVVMLEPPKDGMSKACVPVAMDLAMKLMERPENYYVSVHNAAYPNGGPRGQLAK